VPDGARVPGEVSSEEADGPDVREGAAVPEDVGAGDGAGRIWPGWTGTGTGLVGTGTDGTGTDGTGSEVTGSDGDGTGTAGVGLLEMVTDGSGVGAGTSGASDGGTDGDSEGASDGGSEGAGPAGRSRCPDPFVRSFDRAAAAQAWRPAASTVASSPVPAVAPDCSESPSSSDAGSSEAALDAGTPADKTSTAPNAAAAVPRRRPPWKPVSERKPSDF